ncbi:MAG: hypothetical protein WD275_05870 [Rhodothermales bacterium]
MKIIRMDGFMSDFVLSSDVDLDRVIDDLMETYRICHQTTAYCIDSGGDLATLMRLRAFDDCAEINLTLANFLLRGSEHAPEMAALCLSISTACADSIRDIEHSDGQLRAAYAACQRSRHASLELLGREHRAEEDARDEAVRESFPASDPPGGES